MQRVEIAVDIADEEPVIDWSSFLFGEPVHPMHVHTVGKPKHGKSPFIEHRIKHGEEP